MNKKLFGLLASFDQQDWKRLGLFLGSAYFNFPPSFVKFHQHLFEYYQRYEKLILFSSEEMFAMGFPSEPFNGGKIDRLQSKFLKAIQQFLIQEQFNEDDLAHDRYLIHALADRKLENQLFRTIQKQYTRTDYKYELSQVFLHKLLVAEIRYQAQNVFHNRSIKANHYLKDLGNQIDLFYSYYRMEYGVVMIMREKLTDYRFDYSFEPQLVFPAKTDNLYDGMKLNQLIFRLFQTGEEQYFEEAKQIIGRLKATVAIQEQKHHIIRLLNYCSKAYLTNKSAFWRSERFELYKLFFEEELCYIGPNMKSRKISVHNYYNFVKLTIYQQGRGEGEKLMKEHRNSVLPSPMKNMADSVLKGMIQLEDYLAAPSKQIAKAISTIIENVNYRLITGEYSRSKFYLIDFYILQLKANYGLNKLTPKLVKTSFDNVRKATKIDPLYLEAYKNFISALRRLYTLKNQEIENHEKLLAIKTSLKDSLIVEREWLLQKIVALDKR